MVTMVFLFHKPYGVLSQFTREGGWESLADYGPFPPGVYPAGRLDADSEGLLLLTDDAIIKRRLTEPRFQHPRTYMVQVERVPDAEALEALRGGIMIGGKKTLPAGVWLATGEPLLPPRRVPIRFRKNVPTAWIELRLTEGRNRQVRRMTAAVGLPALRLVRVRIGRLTLAGITPGESRRLDDREINDLRRELGILP